MHLHLNKVKIKLNLFPPFVYENSFYTTELKLYESQVLNYQS